MGVDLPETYRPSEDEPYMNEKQLEYFKRKLLAWRDQLLAESDQTLALLREQDENETDFADRGSLETDRSLELKAQDRHRKLIYKIEEALARIHDGAYGYCEETDEEIGIKRLEARPIATLSIEAQKRHEAMEKKGKH